MHAILELFNRRVGLLALLSVPGLGSAQVLDLSLAEAFDRVDAASRQVLIARQSVEEARQLARTERADLFPQIDLVASQNRARTAIVGQTANFFPDGSPVPEYFVNNSFSAKLTGSLTLFDTEVISEYLVARLEREAAEFALEDILQDAYQLVAQTYFLHLRNVARLSVIEANLQRDTVLLELAQAQREAGVATPIDVTRAEVTLANDERERLQQLTEVTRSRVDLLRLLALPIDRELRLSGLQPSEAALDALARTDLDAALQQRGDYRQAQRQLERNQVARRAAGLQRLPSLSLVGEWGYASEVIFDGDEQEEWLIGVSVAIPVFEGFRIDADKLRADALIRQQEAVIGQIEDQVQAGLIVARQDVRSRFEQIALARRASELSAQELELARARFTEGVADNRDLVDAQARLAEAEDGLVDALFQYQLALVNLARVRGDVRSLLSGQ